MRAEAERNDQASESVPCSDHFHFYSTKRDAVAT